jgi:hypothetical protein
MRWQEIQFSESGEPFFTTTAKQRYYINDFMKTDSPFTYEGIPVQAIQTVTNSLVIGIEVSPDGENVRYVWIGGSNG